MEDHDNMYVPYYYQTGDCMKCKEVGYTPPRFETTVIDMRKMIQFSREVAD